MGRKLLSALSPELERIDDKMLADVVKRIVNEVSDRHAIEPASSTGKYHPAWSLGKGGLLRHTKAVCWVLNRFLTQIPTYDDPSARDIPWCAAILHDLQKYTTDREHSNQDHPMLMGKILRDHATFFGDDPNDLGPRLIRIAECVETHMSRWHTGKDGTQFGVMPTKFEHWIVAMADYLSADKTMINPQFNEKNNIIY